MQVDIRTATGKCGSGIAACVEHSGVAEAMVELSEASKALMERVLLAAESGKALTTRVPRYKAGVHRVSTEDMVLRYLNQCVP